MNQEIVAKWTNGLSFDINVNGFNITVDASKEHGGNGKGPTPKPLLLAALAGCTGMDIVSILEKMQVKIEDFSILTQGELNEEHPKKYNTIKIIYTIKGTNLTLEKVQKAVNLSKDKYCGVAATLSPGVKLEYEINLL